MLKSQNSVCAICGQPETEKNTVNETKHLAVDHQEKPFKIRGLLCAACNQAIGKLRHDPEILRKAIKYLEKYQKCVK